MKPVTETLKSLIASHGEDILQQPQRLKAMLADLLPHEKRMRYLLEVSLRAEIPQKLMDIQQENSSVQGIKTNSLKHYFKEEYFLEDNAVKSVFDCWIEIVLFIDSIVLSVDYDVSDGEYIDEFGVKYNAAKTKLVKLSNNLIHYDILASTKVICNNAFYDCSGLKSIYIPDSVELIGLIDFWEDDELEKFFVSHSNSHYCTIDGVLYSKDRTEIIRFPIAKPVSDFMIPSSVEKVGEFAFQTCKYIKSIQIPDSVTSIEIYSFNECINLEEINVADTNNIFSSINGVLYSKDKKKIRRFPPAKKEHEYHIIEGVEVIVIMAFHSCTNLETVEIPDSVTKIGYRAFYNCSNLNHLNIPENVYLIEESTFSCCIALNSLSVSENNKLFEIRESSLIDLADNKLLYYPIQSNYSRYKIPNEVISIGYEAFFFNRFLEEIIFPDSVNTLEHRSFILSRNLKHVYLPKNIEKIGNSAFSLCYELRSVNFSNSQVAIGRNIFLECNKLELICIDYTGNSTDFSLYEKLTSMFSNHKSVTILKTPIWTEQIYQTIEIIANSIEYLVFSSENIKEQDIQDELDSYYNTFLEIKEEYESKGSEKGVVHANSYIENWVRIEQMTLNVLTKRSGLIMKSNNIDSNIFMIEFDSSIGISKKLFRFLSTIENGKTHYLTGESFYEPFRNIFEVLKGILSETSLNFDSIIIRLQENNKGKDKPSMNNLISKLNSIDLDKAIISEFVEVMKNNIFI